jgi:signal transduction histidine kinase
MTENVQKKDNFVCPVFETQSLETCVYADILKHIDVGIIILDINKEQIAFQNTEAKFIFEDTLDFVDYRTLSTLLLQDMGKGLISDGFGKPQTLHYKNRLLGYTVYPISDTYTIILIRDITENARLQSIAEAVNAMENITYIFSGIRHELGNPINSIKMTLSVLKKNLDRYSQDTIQEYVDRTLAEIMRVEYLLKSLKSFSMFENPSIQHVDLTDFMELFQSLVAGDLEKSGIELNITVSPKAKWVRADSRALQQVMLNLIANAADALEDSDNPEIVISAVKKDDLVWIDVEDNGVGIRNEDQKNLFKPFYTTKPNGTGLGLVITRKMLAKMNGRIGIVSREGVGTTATISIPEGRVENA